VGVRTLDRPDKDVYIDVATDGSCNNTAQTRNKTCDLLLADDPDGVVCQEGADGPDRFIVWESTGDFTLEFPDGHPFVNLMGRCLPNDPAHHTKRCKLKNKGAISKDFFKYDIVFTTSCRWDPHILIRR